MSPSNLRASEETFLELAGLPAAVPRKVTERESTWAICGLRGSERERERELGGAMGRGVM